MIKLYRFRLRGYQTPSELYRQIKERIQINRENVDAIQPNLGHIKKGIAMIPSLLQEDTETLIIIEIARLEKHINTILDEIKRRTAPEILSIQKEKLWSLLQEMKRILNSYRLNVPGYKSEEELC